MWIRINDFIINFDNVTNINIAKEYVYISFCHGSSVVEYSEYSDGSREPYWSSLAFKKGDVPDSAWKIIKALPKNS